MADVKVICKTDAKKIYSFWNSSNCEKINFFYSKKVWGKEQFYVYTDGRVFGPYQKLPEVDILNYDPDDFSWYAFVKGQEYCYKNGEATSPAKEQHIMNQEEIGQLLDEIGRMQDNTVNEKYDEEGHAIIDGLDGPYVLIDGKKKDFFDGKCVNTTITIQNGHTLICGYPVKNLKQNLLKGR